MLSKSMSDRSAPHHGMGRFWKCLSAFSRNLRIQSGSDFMEEISSTTASESPLLGVKTEWSGSLQPKRYPLVSSSRCCSCVVATTSVYPRRHDKVDPPGGIRRSRQPDQPFSTGTPTNEPHSVQEPS